jgi:hypothetical protein
MAYMYMVSRKKFDESTYIELYWTYAGYRIRFRDIRTGRFKAFQPIMRLTYDIQTIPIRNVYYSSIGHLYGSNYVVEKYKNWFHGEFISWSEEKIGYSEDEWWPTISEVNESITEYKAVSTEEAVDIYNAVNNGLLIWEREKKPEDTRRVETGYG